MSDMFTIPRPQTSIFTPSPPSENDVGLTEDSWTMGLLLSLIYPLPYELPDKLALDKLFSLLTVAGKYDLRFAATQIEMALLSRAMGDAKEALQIYAIGSSMGNEKLLKEASRGCLKCTPKDLFELDNFASVGQPVQNAYPGLFGNAVFRLTEDDSSTSMAYLLRKTSAWEYHRLISLYRKRTREAKEIISSIPRGKDAGGFQYQNRYLKLSCDRCSGDVGSKWKIRAEAELEASGPTSERIFSREFFSSCIENNCETCCKAILHDNAPFFDELKKRIDALPDSV
jgi:hypothetical protein